MLAERCFVLESESLSVGLRGTHTHWLLRITNTSMFDLIIAH